MLNSIINDLKNSSLGERALLGIIAGLFAVAGFYVGYEHLSNGVNPILIGAITAFVVMIGCMAAAFIIEELLRKIPAHKANVEGAKPKTKEAKAKEPKEPKVALKRKPKEEAPIAESIKDDASKVETEKPETLDEPKTTETPKVTEPVVAPKETVKRMTLIPTAPKRPEVPAKATLPVVEEKKEEPEAKSDPSAWDEDENIVVKKQEPIKPAAPVRPSLDVKTLPAKDAPVVSTQVPEEQKKDSPLSLEDFIKQNPGLSARKMVREYRLAGGTESTDNILSLMG